MEFWTGDPSDTWNPRVWLADLLGKRFVSSYGNGTVDDVGVRCQAWLYDDDDGVPIYCSERSPLGGDPACGHNHSRFYAAGTADSGGRFEVTIG